MNDYILEFEHLYYKMAEHDMKLPDTILAFKFIDGAGLNEAQRQFGKEVNLYFSTSGHYRIDIQPNKVSKMDLPVEGQSKNVLIFEENMNLSDKKKQIRKDTQTVWTCIK